MAKKAVNKGILDLVGRIEERFGSEAISGKSSQTQFVSSGSLLLDEALGGGWAIGRVVEAYGQQSCGKSTAAFHLVAEVQKSGKAAGYIDTEQAVDMVYMKALGVDTSANRLIFCQPDAAEDAMEIAKEMCSYPEMGVVILDSVAGLVPRALMEGEAGDAKIGLLARLMSSQINILKNICKKSGCILFCINQVRANIGAMGYGPQSTTPGGNAIPFYASQRIEMARMGSDKEGQETVANKVKITVRKNKVAAPYKVANIVIRFGVGFDRVQEIVNLGMELGVIEKGERGWLFYNGEKLGFGLPKVRKVLMSDETLFDKIKEDILAKSHKPNEEEVEDETN